MDIAGVAINNRVTTHVLCVCLLVGGLICYGTLPKLEDPEFTLKDAKVITYYPGATALEVEEEVTEVIEQAVQKLGQLDEVTSESIPGRSLLTVTIKDSYDKSSLPQVWDELRRKVSDAQSQLPPGTMPTIVNDDFGDVYGVFIAVTGDGFSYAELDDHVDDLERELLLCQDVAKVTSLGRRQEVIFVEISRTRLAQLGISERQLYAALEARNVVTPAGKVQVGREYLRIRPTGEFDSVEAIGDVVVERSFSDSQVYLRDIASIYRGYQDPPDALMRVDGRPAIGIGVSTISGGNVVVMGESVTQRLNELLEDIPHGIDVHTVYDQPSSVVQSVRGFVISLIEAVLIVIGVLLVAMGMRSGLIIGAILLLTILATLICMQSAGIAMERISLGALIIAMGMLVDNAIVVTEGILVRIQQGRDRLEAALEAVSGTMWPLLGATFVAIMAFAGIGLSQDATGEYCRSLFYVVMYSLLLSWVLAVTATPLYCIMFLEKGAPAAEGNEVDPYAGAMFRAYSKLLSMCLRYRWVTVIALVVMLVAAVLGFGKIEQSFFPDATTPQFTVDYWLPEGTHISQTDADMQVIGEHIRSLESVTSVASFIGTPALLFSLTYKPEPSNPAYGQMIVSVTDFEEVRGLIEQIETYITDHFPSAMAWGLPYALGPGGGAKIQARIHGPEIEELRRQANRISAIFEEDGGLRDIRSDWRQRVKVMRADLAESQLATAGLARADVSSALQRTFSGLQVGVYREGDNLLPVIARAPERERADADRGRDVLLWSPSAQQSIPLRQVVSEFDLEFEEALIARKDRRRTITIKASARSGAASIAFARIRPLVEGLALPPGYHLEWGGEYEDSTKAQASLASKLPLVFVFMILIVIGLFNSLKQPAIIFLTVPLALIGVSAGLLATGQPFGFMAILGVLSLIGMLIKNAIVLIDEIDGQIRGGKQPYAAIMDSSLSRMRPVSMAAMTTVLGMLPLVPDVFFGSMAVTIMAGLSFATVLTLVFVPVLYAIFFRVAWIEAPGD